MKTFATSNLFALLVSCASDKDCVAFDDAKFCASDGFCHLSYDYCSSATCGEKDGDCNNDFQCEGDLVCAINVFLIFHPLVINGNSAHDVCTQICDVDEDCPENTFCTCNSACIPFEDYCSSFSNLCSLYEGDCDNDNECIGDLVCGSNNFIIRHPNVTTTFDDKDASQSTNDFPPS